jgi:hypothetical protein
MPTVRETVLALGAVLCAPVAAAGQGKVDALGDPLPDGATARLGTSRGVIRANHFVGLPPDFKSIAYVERDGAVVVRESVTGREVSRVPLANPHGNAAVVAASADGRRLATWEFGVIFVREVATGRVVLQFRPPPPNAPSMGQWNMHNLVSLSADGKRIAVGSMPLQKQGEPPQDLAVTVWDVDKNQLVARVTVPERCPVAPVLSPDGKLLATWCVNSRGPVAPPSKPGEIPYPRPAGGMRSERDCVVRLWDATTGKIVGRIPLAGPLPTAVAFSRNGEMIAVAADGGRIEWWDTQTTVWKAFAEAGTRVYTIVFSPDGTSLAAGVFGGVARRWATTDGKLLSEARIPLEVGLWTTGVTFAGDDRLIAAGMVGPAAVVWESPGKLLTPLGANITPVYAVGFTLRGKEILTLSSVGFVRWDAATGKPLGPPVGGPVRDERGFAPPLFFGPEFSAAVSADGTRGVGVKPVTGLGGERTPPRFTAFDPTTGRETSSFPVKMGVEESVFPATNTGLSRLVVVRPAADWRVAEARCHVFDVDSEKLLAEPTLSLPAPFGYGSGAAVSPDGTRLITAVTVRPPRLGAQPPPDPKTVFNLWDLATGKELGRIEGEQILAGLRLSAASNTAGAFCGGRVGRFDFSAGRVEVANEDWVGGGMQIAPAFNAGATRFAAAYEVGPKRIEVRVYDWPSGAVRHRFAGHTAAVTALAFSPDGKTLASASQDNTVLLWDLSGK